MKMVTVMKVIPFSLWEKLKNSGTLDSYFVEEKPDPIQSLVKSLPVSLQDRAQQIISILCTKLNLTWNEKNEIELDGTVWTCSNLSKLVYSVVVGACDYEKLESAGKFLILLEKAQVPHYLYNKVFGKCTKRKLVFDSQVEKSRVDWIAFEDNFKLA